ncbi:FAD-dependent tricarballylate dehydrogenase TcuA [soil metagenome]
MNLPSIESFDVIVVGGGNAALCAALSAAEQGARVAVLERAPRDRRGGNSAFTGGAFRVVYDGVDDLRKLVPDMTDQEADSADFGTYTAEQFYDEWTASSQYRCDADIVDKVVKESQDTLLWLIRNHRVRFVPLFGRQAFKVGGKFKFWGGLTIEASGGGLGLMETLYQRAEERSDAMTVHYGTRVTRLERDPAQQGWIVHCTSRDGPVAYTARAVVLASGGFHANLEWRARYLGPGWDMAKVRGSRYNTGDGIQAALDIGAMAHGNWTGCHSVFFDMNAQPFGDLGVLNQQKNYFTLGVVVNADGKRFFDEGTDLRNYTYSLMGARVLAQPGAIAWQVFDQQTASLLPDEYRVRHATRVEAPTLEALADKMDGVDKAGFLATMREFNAAVQTDRPFNPAVKDGRCTTALAIPKSNWSLRLEQGPFVAYGVTCGITCTYGGVKVDTDARVLDQEDRPIDGLYATGELVGGLYYVKYAGGAGLTAGSVLGRTAGRHAARTVLDR